MIDKTLELDHLCRKRDCWGHSRFDYERFVIGVWLLMNKDYSDLSDRQKLIYIKRLTIIIITGVIPVLFLTGFILIVDDYHDMNIDDSNYEGLQFVLPVLIMCSIIGVMFIGLEFGYYLVEKMNLYTDINLERVEKRLKKIKESMKDEL